MIDKQSDKEFNSKPYIRRLERERRQRENDMLFKSFSVESKQIQDNIYYNVFTEEGQNLLLSMSHIKKNVGSQDMNNLSKKKLVNGKVKYILSQMVEIVTPKRERKKFDRKDQLSPTTEDSYFPEIGPIGIAAKRFTSAQANISPQKHNTDSRLAVETSMVEIRKKIKHLLCSYSIQR